MPAATDAGAAEAAAAGRATGTRAGPALFGAAAARGAAGLRADFFVVLRAAGRRAGLRAVFCFAALRLPAFFFVDFGLRPATFRRVALRAAGRLPVAFRLRAFERLRAAIVTSRRR